MRSAHDFTSPLVGHRLAMGLLGACVAGVCLASPPARKSVAAPPAPALTATELEVAQLVHVGLLPCELGQSVRLDADPQSPGYFRLQLHREVFRMRPVESRTGAIRLEDSARGAVWIQLGNKSMLMSQKQGRRLADECASDQQRTVAQALKSSPVTSLFDPLPQGQ